MGVREPEACDWCPKPATKRIEDVRGYETGVACDGCVKYGIRYVLPINDPRCGDRHDDDDPEGGVSVPAGDSPDSPPAGESRLPGPGDYLVTDDANADYAGGTWPVLPVGYSAISISNVTLLSRNGHWYEVPEGTSTEDFLASLENSEARIS